MGRALKWIVVVGALGAAGVVLVRRNRTEFDPARPTLAWGTRSLTIDERGD